MRCVWQVSQNEIRQILRAVLVVVDDLSQVSYIHTPTTHRYSEPLSVEEWSDIQGGEAMSDIRREYEEGDDVIVDRNGKPGKVHTKSTCPNNTVIYGVRYLDPDMNQKRTRSNFPDAVDVYCEASDLTPTVW